MDEYKHLKELRHAAPYVGVYAIFWGCAYLLAYWSYFNINPFQYIGASEVVLQAGKVLFQGAIFVLLILLFAYFSSRKEPIESRRIAELKALPGHILVVTSVACVALYFADSSPALYGSALAIMMLLITPISYTDLFSHSFSSPQVRTSVAAFTIFLPVSTMLTAYTEAKNILNDKGELTYIKRPADICSKGCALIGKIGDYFAVKSSNQNILLIKSEEMKVFQTYTLNKEIKKK